MPTILIAHNTSTSLTAGRFRTVLTAHPINLAGAADIQWIIQNEAAEDILNEAGEILVDPFESTPAGRLTAPRVGK